MITSTRSLVPQIPELGRRAREQGDDGEPAGRHPSGRPNGRPKRPKRAVRVALDLTDGGAERLAHLLCDERTERVRVCGQQLAEAVDEGDALLDRHRRPAGLRREGARHGVLHLTRGSAGDLGDQLPNELRSLRSRSRSIPRNRKKPKNSKPLSKNKRLR